MNSNREIELKLKITENIYNKLISEYSVIKGPFKQVNTFFDSKDFMLIKNKWALRLRNEEGNFFLTAKGPARKTEGYYDRTEIEEKIELKEKALSLFHGFYLNKTCFRPCIELYKAFGNLFVSDIFSFTNLRTLVKYESLTLELDKTFIRNNIFHELEIEAEMENIENTSEKIKELFSSNKWKFEYSRHGKMSKAVRIFLGDNPVIKNIL